MKSIAPSKSRTEFTKILHSDQQAGTLASADLFPEQTRALPMLTYVAMRVLCSVRCLALGDPDPFFLKLGPSKSSPMSRFGFYPLSGRCLALGLGMRPDQIFKKHFVVTQMLQP